ncbi:MAG: Crp/Fnr family transcriptional regulator [Flavipsychrobacter sp.]|nr:Crp/Fnr family transcriptional regulator [Flavipsychrobacter sp.]
MVQALLNHVNRFVSLNTDEQHLLLDHLSVRHVNKKEHILVAGAICTANYFVLNGCFRMYFIKESGQEQIVQFGLNNWWISDLTSLESGKPSGFYIQAIEDANVAVLTKQNQELLFSSMPKAERYFRLVMQKAYAASLMRLQYLFDLSAEERYHHFNTAYPEFVQRVPQYMLASYLGFTPEVLSKIRAKK